MIRLGYKSAPHVQLHNDIYMHTACTLKHAHTAYTAETRTCTYSHSGDIGLRRKVRVVDGHRRMHIFPILTMQLLKVKTEV